jgi:hypothetical protein
LPGMMAQIYNPSIQEVEAEDSRIPGQPGIGRKNLS